MLVIDTSVAIKWAVNEPGSEEAAELLPCSLVAPDLFQAEVANVLTKKARGRELSVGQARLAFDRILSRVELLASAPFGSAAFDLSSSLAHSVYDCYFLAAAEAEGLVLVTADTVFAAKVRTTSRAALVYLLGEEIPDD
ncbi:MAG: type II toxin-antitoxin system VapC family toxin [Allosphingosinicella sp.]